MTRPKRSPGHSDDHRNRITRAAITGVIAGITRAILDALLRHLITGC